MTTKHTHKAFSISVHMVASVDGLIAKPDNSVSWFETSGHYEKGLEYDPAGVEESIDCYVMGSRTYEHALELSEKYGWAYGDKPTIVVSNRKLSTHKPNISFYSGDLKRLVSEQLKPRYSNVWVVGGAALTREFIRQGLATDIRMSVLPILLGEGKPFFDQIEMEKQLHLKDVSGYRNGMIEVWYEL